MDADVRATSALRQALRSGAMGGSVGAVKLSTIEVADLDSAIALAESAEPIAAQRRRVSTRAKASTSQVQESIEIHRAHPDCKTQKNRVQGTPETIPKGVQKHAETNEIH